MATGPNRCWRRRIVIGAGCDENQEVEARLRPERQVGESRNDVGYQLVLDPGNLILQRELALFQALQLERVLERVDGDAADDVVQVSMLGPQFRQAAADLIHIIVDHAGIWDTRWSRAALTVADLDVKRYG